MKRKHIAAIKKQVQVLVLVELELQGLSVLVLGLMHTLMLLEGRSKGSTPLQALGYYIPIVYI